MNGGIKKFPKEVSSLEPEQNYYWFYCSRTLSQKQLEHAQTVLKILIKSETLYKYKLASNATAWDFKKVIRCADNQKKIASN